MIVTILAAVSLVHGHSAQAAKLDQAVIDRFRKFYVKPGAVEINFKISFGPQSKIKEGRGKLVVVPTSKAPKPQRWDLSLGTFDYHYVSDGTTAIEWSKAEGKYDRHLARFGEPLARITTGGQLGYPVAWIRDRFEAWFRSNPKSEKQGNNDVLTADQKTVSGEVHFKGVFAPDGRMVEMVIDSTSRGRQSTTDWVVESYKPLPKIPVFDTKPKPGYVPSQIPDLVEMPIFHDKIPAVPVRGDSKTTLAKLCEKGHTFFVFTEEKLPAKLVSELKSIDSSAKVIVLATEPLKLPFPVYQISQQGLDLAGVSGTPQFYLTKDGKLEQAWQGWSKRIAKTFVDEVRTVIKNGPQSS